MFIVFSFLVTFILFLQKYLGISGQFFDISKLIFFLNSKNLILENFVFLLQLQLIFLIIGKKIRIFYIQNLKRKKIDPHPQL